MFYHLHICLKQCLILEYGKLDWRNETYSQVTNVEIKFFRVVMSVLKHVIESKFFCFKQFNIIVQIISFWKQLCILLDSKLHFYRWGTLLFSNQKSVYSVYGQ